MRFADRAALPLCPLVLDLCAGERGWGDGFEADGWIVLGVDKTPFKGKCSPPQLVRDIRDLKPEDYLGLVDLLVASPPCTEFSKWDAVALYPRLQAPDMSLVNFCFQFARDLGVPLVLENVRGLQKFIGSAVNHYGSFYLWGDVPPLKPYIPGRAGRPALKWKHRSPRLRAKIPFELAYTVAQYHHERLRLAAEDRASRCVQTNTDSPRASRVYQHTVPPWADRVPANTDALRAHPEIPEATECN